MLAHLSRSVTGHAKLEERSTTMYNPGHFAEHRTEVLHSFMRQHPFAILVTNGPAGPDATHLPVVFHPEVGAQGALRCHLAKGNQHWRFAEDSTTTALVIFQGVDHYIAPAWYPSTTEHGKVVPTWNYLVVHVRGRARILDKGPDLISHLRELTEQSEAGIEKPWSVDDPPNGYIEALAAGIVGIEIEIESIEGKWKASQNRNEADREGVIAGLRSLGSYDAASMAAVVEERSQEKKQ